MRHAKRWRGALFLGTGLMALLAIGHEETQAQRPRLQQFLQRPLLQQVFQPSQEIEVVAGQPFGVGKVTVPLDGMNKNADTQTLAAVLDRHGRVFYPAYASAPVREAIREIISAPPRATVYFLFRGAEPLELTQPVPGVVQPKVDADAHQRLLSAWWKEYSGQGGLLPRSDSGPPDVRSYLTGMLARRLGLPGPDPLQLQQQRSEITQALGILTGSESIRSSILQETLAGLTDGNEPANLPLPAAPNPPPGMPEEVNPNVAVTIEPIAMHVPEECLYVRFGNFPNFLWLQQRLESVGGDLGNFIFETGVDYGARARMETQLCAHQSALAPVLGPQVIADVAFIGTDTFQREGASLGILFQAKNNTAVRFDFSQQRSETLKRETDAKEEKLQIGDVTASFIYTPDNRVRSIYVQDGDFHLLTSSRKIAERFVETGQGKRALGKSAEFNYARRVMPATQDQTAFIYLSEAFQRNLLSPQYQVEMVRRLRSVAEMQLLQLARLAAAGEGVPGESIEQLVAAKLLPSGFGARADGSRLIENPKGTQDDSLRGRRGTFLPVPDVKIENITASEARVLDRFTAIYNQQWQQMDPVLVAVERRPGPEGLERVIVNAHAAPFAEKHFKTLSKWLGPPSQQRLVPVPGDLISAQASVRGGTLMSTGDHQLFGALRDADPAFATQGLASLLFKDLSRSARGYIGAWPQPGLIGILGGTANAPVDAGGYSRLLLGQWRRIYGQFTLLSFHPEVLEEVAPQLRFEPAAQPAQIWLRSEDLVKSKLSQKINSFGYGRALRGSQGNARFINSFSEQLRAPQKQGLAMAEKLLDAKLIDPLGGKYELLPTRTGRALWMSTITSDPRFQGTDSMPPNYQFPALKWLRGMNVALLMEPGNLVAHAEIDLPALTRVSGVEIPALPSLTSFPSLPFSLPSFGTPAAADKSASDGADEALPKPPRKKSAEAPEKKPSTLPAPGPPAPGE